MQLTLPQDEETVLPADCHELSGQWRGYKLGEIAQVQTGPFGSQLHASDYTEEGVPVIMPSDLIDGFVSEANISRIPHAIAQPLSRHFVQEGDIILARRGDIGRAAFIGHKEVGWVCGTGCLRVRPGNKVISELVYRLVSRSDSVKWLTQNAVVQTMLNLSASVVAELPVSLPPLAEQAYIVEALNAADNAIRALERLNEAKFRYKRALAEQLLTGKRRFAAFKDQAWRETILGNFLSEKSEYYPIDETPVVLSCSKLYGILLQSDRFSKQLASRDLRRYKFVEPGNLVFDPMLLWDASIAFSELRGVVSPAYCTLRFVSEQADRRFFHYLLYTAISKGTNARRKKVLASDFLKIKVQIPSLAEQSKIADVLGLLDAEIGLLCRELDALKKQKQELMQKLLTGQVRVKEFAR